MESTLDIETANGQAEPEEALADDERIALIADELREAIRRKISPLPA